jgi:hypothetical protein
MTTEIEQIPGWATSGTKTAPSGALSSSGFTGGTQAAAQNWNFLEDEDRTKANELVDAVNQIHDDDGSGFPHGNPQDSLMTKNYIGVGDRCLSAWDQDNSGPGNADVQVDLAIYIDPDGAVKLMVLIANDGTPTVEIYDTELKNAPTIPLISSSGDLSGDLPSGGGESWQALSFCTDGTSVYITFQDTVGATHYIQAWDIATWTVKSGWPATGTALPGTGVVGASGYISAVEIANPNRLVTANEWNSITLATSPAISIINIATGAIVASGAGDHPLGGVTASANRVSSDGTDVFFTVNGNYVCSAQIASPSTGGSSPDMPHNLQDANDVCVVGETVMATSWVPSVCMSFHHRTSGHIGDATSGALSVLRSLGSIAFDGAGFWCLGTVDRSGSRSAVFKIEPGQAIPQTISSAPGPLPGAEYFVKSTISNRVDTTGGSTFAPIVFDGRNVWFAAVHGGTSRVYRIPRALNR